MFVLLALDVDEHGANS